VEHEVDREARADRIRQILAANDTKALVRELRSMRPQEVAEILDEFEPREKAILFNAMSVEAAAEMLDEADENSQQQIMSETDKERIVEVLDELPPDEAADILGVVKEGQAEELLEEMEPRHAEQVEELLEYPPDTAGGAMTTEFIALPAGMTAREAIEFCQRKGPTETLSYLYVVDENNKLLGVLPFHALVFSPPDAEITELMDPEVISVNPYTDREEVANIVQKYDLLAVPVVDDDGVLKGIVTVDDVIEAIEEEVSEDMFRIAGTGEKDPIHGSIRKKVWLRLPWLMVTLLGGLAICRVVGGFQGSISKVVALASFLPLIPLMGGNVAIQASTIIVRGIATGDIVRGNLARVIGREILVAAIMGTICGLVAAGMAQLLHGAPILGVVIGTAVFSAVVVAATLGTLMPLLFHAIGIDPAVAAGPFVTILNDLTSVTIYLTLATLLILHLKPG